MARVEDALKYFRARRRNLVESWLWEELLHEEHARAFTVSKSKGFDILGDIANALYVALARRMNFRKFHQLLKPQLIKKGWWGRREVRDPDGKMRTVQLGSKGRLRTIFYINMAVSRAARRWQYIQEQREHFPYLMYDATNGQPPCLDHQRWDGLVLPTDDEFWHTHAPPNGLHCRCIVHPVSTHTMRERGLSVSPCPNIQTRTWRDPNGIMHNVPVGILPGWDYNPGSAHVTEAWRKAVMDLEPSASNSHPEDMFRARSTIENIVGQAEFKHFTSGRRSGRPPELQVAWPVAILNAQRTAEIGLGNHPQVVVLTAANVEKSHHAERWRGSQYDGAGWANLNRAIADGEYFLQGKGNHFFYVPANKKGKMWVAIIYKVRNELRLANFMYANDVWVRNKANRSRSWGALRPRGQ